MLTLYICLGYCAAPLAFVLTLWRGIGDRSYWRALPERFGFGPTLAPGGIWIHAVSVGEVQAAAVLVRSLRARYPTLPLIVSCSTPTGRRRAEDLYAGAAIVRYLPYDLPDAVARFLRRIRPQVGVLVETELWPNLYRAAARRGIPLVIASARLSERSMRRYRCVRSLARRMLATGVVIAAQTEADAKRFVALGAPLERTHVTGNLKFDFELPPDVARAGDALRALLGASRPVWVAGSTHAIEEEALLDAHLGLTPSGPAALLVLAPRHPARFAAVAALLERRRVRAVRRTHGAAVTESTEVLLLDTLGELLQFYAAADVAFVGGTLVPVGGHNLLEPAALARPIACGPYTANSAAVAQQLIEVAALKVVADARELSAQLMLWFDDPALRIEAGTHGRTVVETNRGTLARLLALIEPSVRAAGD